LILRILMAAFMVYGGINHFLNPTFYEAFMPDFFPKDLANYASGIAEIGLGIALLIPRYRKTAAWGLIALMIIFLPLHIWDLFKEAPAIGSKTAAWIRIPIQFLFIAWIWWLGQEDEQS
ncbi:MAG: DoxX family membrane protein, partial [Bacteroidota bacterium]